MYEIIRGLDICFVRLTSNLNKNDFYELSDQLVQMIAAENLRLKMILIDCQGEYTVDFSFESQVQDLVAECMARNTEISFLNSKNETQELIQSLGLSMMIKTRECSPDKLEAVLAAANGSRAPEKPDAEQLSRAVSTVIAKVFETIGFDISEDVKVETGSSKNCDIFSVCQLNSGDAELFIGLRFIDPNRFSNLVRKFSTSESIDEDMLKTWSNEILNMVIAQLVTSPDNEKWNLQKVGQPFPAGESNLGKKEWSKLSMNPNLTEKKFIEMTYFLESDGVARAA